MMRSMKVALFSQSLFALPLAEAIAATARLGFPAIELACAKPHFDLETARRDPARVAAMIRRAGLEVAALSLFNNFTDRTNLDEQVEAASVFIRLAPVFGTKLVKLTPGPPGSREATAEHWRRLTAAVERLIPTARSAGARLAFETHMRQLTDTLASSLRFIATTPADTIGLCVDFCNLAFAGEQMSAALAGLTPRMLHAHLKNGCVAADGGWHFKPLDTGWTDYAQVLTQLRAAGYDGYFSIECLGPDAKARPLETAANDLAIFRQYMRGVKLS